MFRDLLVAFDGSSHAQRALDEAGDLAQATAGRLTVMTVVPEPSTWALSSGYGAAVNLDELVAEIEREYQTMLDSAVDTIADDVPVNKIFTRTRGRVDRRRGKCKRSRPDRHGIARARRASLNSARQRQPPRPASEPRPRTRGSRLRGSAR